MSKTFIHHGPYETISPNCTISSPGLLFLRSFLPALESLDPIHPHPVAPFIAPDAVWIVNSNIPAMTSQVLPMLELRSKHVSKFHHDVRTAWDIEWGMDSGDGDGDGRQSDYRENEESGEGPATGSGGARRKDKSRRKRRTVMYQATSGTVFKQDPEQFEIRMEEFNIVELLAEHDDEGEEGKGDDGCQEDEKDRKSTSNSTSSAPYGYKAVGLRTFVDPRPVMERAGELQAQFAQGAA